MTRHDVGTHRRRQLRIFADFADLWDRLRRLSQTFADLRERLCGTLRNFAELCGTLRNFAELCGTLRAFMSPRETVSTTSRWDPRKPEFWQIVLTLSLTIYCRYKRKSGKTHSYCPNLIHYFTRATPTCICRHFI
jgi:hypothetical protein